MAMTKLSLHNDFMTILIFPFKYEGNRFCDVPPSLLAGQLAKENREVEEGWTVQYFSIDTEDKYSEYYYFHPFVRNVIFARTKEDGIRFLTRKDYTCLKLGYFDSDTKKIKSIAVGVTSIDLHLFDNQIGLLSITTEQTNVGFEEKLIFNDLARRIYPPYLGKNNSCGLKYESRMLPTSISLTGKIGPIEERFDPVDLDNRSDRDILFMSKIILDLLTPLNLKDRRDLPPEENKVFYSPFSDDRMFVLSFCADDSENSKRAQAQFEDSDDWYRFVFVDGFYKSIANMEMQKELLKRHSYARWEECGTLFGMTRYSLVCLCSPGMFSPILKSHMKACYYQMALLMLLQRSMLLKFSEDIDSIMKKYEREENLKVFQMESGKLKERFIKFINKYWFIEVTSQEQGFEMYNRWMGLLNLEKLYTEIRNEISDLSSFVDNSIESETSKRVDMITMIGLPLAFLALILSFWGIPPEMQNSDWVWINSLKLIFNKNMSAFLFFGGVLSAILLRAVFRGITAYGELKKSGEL